MQIDISSGDLLIDKGKAVIASTDSYIAHLVILSFRGEIKEFPLIGAEAKLLCAGQPDPFWAGNTKKMLLACGVAMNDITVQPDGIITIK